ncbi:MAG: HIT family protein, partial [Pseudobdellovibrionaceae bacterium]
MSCIFCKIIKGDSQASLVYRDEICSAFMDIHPINPGHVLIVPNEHFESVDQLPEGTGAGMFLVASKIYKALMESEVRMDGANIFLSNGEAAGQEVPHCHIHVVPRFRGDGQRIGFK